MVALSLTACGGGPAVESGQVETETSTRNGFVSMTDQQGSVEGYVGASEDVIVEKCESSGENWVAEGTATNPTGETQNYRIYVAFNKNRDTKGLVQVDLESVGPNASAEWKAESPISGEKIDCLLRVERFN